jgi:hypothetical protein
MNQWDKRTILSEKEAFNLDFFGCKEAPLAMDYLSFGFQDDFKYSFRSLVFFPRQKVSFNFIDVLFFISHRN